MGRKKNFIKQRKNSSLNVSSRVQIFLSTIILRIENRPIFYGILMITNPQPVFKLIELPQQLATTKIHLVANLPTFEPGFNYNHDDMVMIDARTDWEAVQAFLEQYSGSTLRSFLLEIERFSLWLCLVAKIPLSGLKRDNWFDYQSFLASAPDSWRAIRQPRFNNDGSINTGWRPFALEPLKPSSINKSMKIIEALFAYLVEVNYLRASPVTKRRRKTGLQEQLNNTAERFLSDDLLNSVCDQLLHLAQTEPVKKFDYIRANFIIQLLRDTGLRISEAAKHTMGNIWVHDNGAWVLTVHGKGDKVRKIKIHKALKNAMMDYRQSIGLTPYPLLGELTPLIPRRDKVTSITTRRIDQILDWAFNLVADSKAIDAGLTGSEVKRGKLLRDESILRKASAHWLRHSHATDYLKQSGSLKKTMDRLGHASVSTTMIYQHSDDLISDAD